MPEDPGLLWTTRPARGQTGLLSLPVSVLLPEFQAKCVPGQLGLMTLQGWTGSICSFRGISAISCEAPSEPGRSWVRGGRPGERISPVLRGLQHTRQGGNYPKHRKQVPLKM